MDTLLVSQQIDLWLGYPRGRAKKMASAGLIPHIVMPDGEIRFDRTVIGQWLSKNTIEVVSDCDVNNPEQLKPEPGDV